MSYRTTREVERLCGVPRDVLQDWERRMRILRPLKDYSGYRQYSQRDIDIIFRLKYLIYTKGYEPERAGAQAERDVLRPQNHAETLIEIRKMRSVLSDSFFDMTDLIKRESSSQR